MKNLIKLAYIMALSGFIATHCELSKAAKIYEETGDIKPGLGIYVRAYTPPVLVSLPLLAATTLAAKRNPMAGILSMQAALGISSIMAYWAYNRADKALGGQELKIQQELARHYALSMQKENELAVKLNRLNLLTDKQKQQLRARALHARAVFQDPSYMALLSNA